MTTRPKALKTGPKPAPTDADSSESAEIRSFSEEITSTEAARRLVMTKQAVGQWASKPGAPVRHEGTRVWCRWPDFMRWREQEMIRTAVAKATADLQAQLDAVSGGGEGEGDPFRRKAFADARKSELDVAEREGSLVPVAAARASFAHRLTAIRNILIAFPRTIAPKLLGAKTLQELERRLDEAVRSLMELLAKPPAIEGVDEPEREAA